MTLGALFALSNLVHVGYVLQLLALLARDVLLLRALLATAQTVIASYAAYRGVYSMACWNMVLVCVNIYWVLRILRERRAIAIPTELQALYEQYFAAMTAREFLRFWDMSKAQEYSATQLTEQGQVPEHLYWLQSGTVALQNGTHAVHSLDAPCFIGEMSLLTGKPATASVLVDQTVQARVWPRSALRKVAASNPALWSKVQSVLGLDLVLKIQREEARVQQAHG